MGLPVGSTLCEIIMDLFENTSYKSNPNLMSNISYWYKYKDILCFWHGLVDILNLLFTTMNFPPLSTPFKYDGKVINFIDVNVSIVNNCHKFAIFRKDTSKDITIHGSSFCHLSHKDAAFYGYVHRS